MKSLIFTGFFLSCTFALAAHLDRHTFEVETLVFKGSDVQVKLRETLKDIPKIAEYFEPSKIKVISKEVLIFPDNKARLTIDGIFQVGPLPVRLKMVGDIEVKAFTCGEGFLSDGYLLEMDFSNSPDLLKKSAQNVQGSLCVKPQLAESTESEVVFTPWMSEGTQFNKVIGMQVKRLLSYQVKPLFTAIQKKYSDLP